jgi:transcription elongation factor Elf1
MGLFDYVLVPCPKCGHQIEGQTKGGECERRQLKIHALTFDEAYYLGFIPCSKCGYEAELDLTGLNRSFDFTHRVKCKGSN